MNARPLISLLAAGITVLVVELAGAPWWLAATAFGCLALGLGLWPCSRSSPRSPLTGSPGGVTAAATGNARLLNSPSAVGW
ncbi:hypothetical protein ACFCYF_41810 [Streptomyces chartreusis]|uniref:hypothetical protein n=1 Tax=Streptomyces chartreusis TaxID=1969 RepID=UPI0035D69748